MNTNHLNNTIQINFTPDELRTLTTAVATVKAILEGNTTDLADWNNEVYGPKAGDIRNLHTGLTEMLVKGGASPELLKAYLG